MFLASVTKGIETAVKKVVEDAAAGNFKGGTQDILDLSNGGTDLVYGQQLGSSIPLGPAVRDHGAEGADHQRHHQDQVAVPAEVTTSFEKRRAMRLELRGITKTFGSVAANSAIDLTVEPGEIHCLLGENGAGKSTLMNILYGLLSPDSGEIVVDGETREFASPGDAIKAGIGMVHQHFMLVPVFTVAENLMLGAEEARGGPLGWLDRRKARPGRQGGLGPLRPAGGPRRAGRGPAGGRAAARRDRQGPDAGRRGADPRRAHRGAHPAGDRGAVHGHAGAEGGRQVGRVHHPQAERGPGDRRPDHRHPPRQGGRQRRAHGHGARAGLADGRPRRAAGRGEGAARARRGRAERAGPVRHGRPRLPGGRRRLLRPARRRDPRRRRRPGQRPDRAGRGDHRPAGRDRFGRAVRPAAGRRLAARGAAPGPRARPGGPAARRPGAGLLHRREPGAGPVRPQALRRRGPRWTWTRSRRTAPSGWPSSTSAPSPSGPRPARCPAATSRRSSSPGRCSATPAC